MDRMLIAAALATLVGGCSYSRDTKMEPVEPTSPAPATSSDGKAPGKRVSGGGAAHAWLLASAATVYFC